MTATPIPKGPCAVAVCPRQAVGHQDYCKQHYVSWRTTGKVPTQALRPMGAPPLERFLAKVNKTSSCWVWTAYLNASGYGIFALPGGRQKICAHRFAYEALVGPIPEGLQLDHLCRNRACVNPTHLEPVTSRTNTMRSDISLAGINAAKRECKRGHEFNEENTYFYAHPKYPRRRCRICQAEMSRAYRTHLRSVVAPNPCRVVVQRVQR